MFFFSNFSKMSSDENFSEMINENENDESNKLFKLSDDVVQFEPISGLTSVFFDRDNQQIFCVRSNGVGGVVVKGPNNSENMSFRLEDKGNVASIKFSPNMSILAIRRKDKCAIDFLNFKSSSPAYPEYTQTFKAKSSKFQDCHWLDSNEILFVSEQGFEHYQVFTDKRALKLIKFYNMPLNWLIWSREAQVFIVSTGSYGSILNPFVYSKGAILKLPKFEVDLPLPLNLTKYRYDSSQATNRYYLNESDVIVGRIYNEFYVMIIRQMTIGEADQIQRMASSSGQQGFSEIAMYKLLPDSPAKKTNILKINLSGRFTLNIIDELIVIHHRNSLSSMVFDIKMNGEFNGYTTCNYPVIKKTSIKSSNEPTKYRNNDFIEMYSINWIMFLPNVIIDAKLGYFWYLEMNLMTENFTVFEEFDNDYLKLAEFLLNRKNTKNHLIKLCNLAIKNKSSLKIIEKLFDKINEFYRISIMVLGQSLPSNATNNLGTNDAYDLNNKKESNQLPIIEQYDMHNSLLYPLLEDESWWNANSKFTIAIIIEYFRSLNSQFIPIEHYLFKLLVNALIKANRLYQLHQYLQYHVLSDSKPLACLLLSIQSTYPAANQLALDMLKRLGTANEEIVDVLLSNSLVISAIRFAIQVGIGDQLNAGKFLETAMQLGDNHIYYEIYKFFENRNFRLRSDSAFRPEENCDVYVKHFENNFKK
jgi:hypothetical protein